jgi:hypothetical protein
MANDPKIVEFGRPELDPEKAAEYDQKIKQARAQIPNMSSRDALSKAKRHTPIGHVERPENMPDLAVAAATSARPGSEIAEELQQGVQPRPPGSPVLRDSTRQQLAEMGEVMKRAPAEAAPAEPESEPAKAEEDLLEALDFGNVRNESERIHNNKERRKAIESRCKEMDFDDLLWKGEVQQTVSVLPGKFEVTFKSLTGDENLFIRKYMAKLPRVSDAHDLDVYSLCQLALSIVAIQGKTEKVFEPLTDKNGEVDENLFKRKLKTISAFAIPVLADLSVNQNWFDIRVRRLLNPEDLKNG